MTAASEPTEQTLTQDLLREILAMTADSAVSVDLPDVSPAAFKPRDGVEAMLASLAVAHVRLIVGSVNEILATPSGPPRARGQAQLVALDRMLLGFLRELRIARKRPDDSFAEAAPDLAPPKPTATPARSAATAPRDTKHPAPVARPSWASHKGALLSGASVLASAAIQPPRAMTLTIPAAPG